MPANDSYWHENFGQTRIIHVKLIGPFVQLPAHPVRPNTGKEEKKQKAEAFPHSLHLLSAKEVYSAGRRLQAKILLKA